MALGDYLILHSPKLNNIARNITRIICKIDPLVVFMSIQSVSSAALCLNIFFIDICWRFILYYVYSILHIPNYGLYFETAFV